MMVSMARAAAAVDAFTAVAGPRRRQILDVLAGGQRPVNDLVTLAGVAQSLVSKHLRILREVGLVDVRDEGRQRAFRLNGQPLRPVYDWVKACRQTWSQRFSRLDAVLDELNDTEDGDDGRGE
jgi:DNA-binding transcriptional ArsR family regulator